MTHKAIIAAELLAFSFTACAQSAQSEEKIEDCRSLETLSQAIMGARQSGVPASKAYEISLRGGDPSVTRVTQALVRLAYSKPQYQSEHYKQQEINEFGSAAFLACIGDK